MKFLYSVYLFVAGGFVYLSDCRAVVLFLFNFCGSGILSFPHTKFRKRHAEPNLTPTTSHRTRPIHNPGSVSIDQPMLNGRQTCPSRLKGTDE